MVDMMKPDKVLPPHEKLRVITKKEDVQNA